MTIQTPRDLEGLKTAGRIVRLALEAMRAAARIGATTAQIDAVGARALDEHGARSAPQLVYDFPGCACISVNDEVVHGVPGERVIQPGDLIKIDVVAEKDGYMADATICVAVPPVSPQARALAQCAEHAFYKAMSMARDGVALRDMGRAIEQSVARCGFSVVKELSGHGVGRTIHEAPRIVPNFYDKKLGEPMREGMVLAIEPIIAAGDGAIVEDGDGWTIRTADGSLASHFEHTIVITRSRPIVLTA